MSTNKEEGSGMWIGAAYFVNLSLAGTLVGNEFGTWAAVHPALGRLSGAESIRAEQEITGRYGAIMPFWMSAVLVSCVPVLALSRGGRSFHLTLAGMLCFAAMLAVTLIGNVPINNRILELAPEADFQEFASLRERWDALHTARIILDIAGLGFLILSALSRLGRSGMERT